MSELNNQANAARTTDFFFRFEWAAMIVLFLSFAASPVKAQNAAAAPASQLTPSQLEIEKQRQRLSFSETEERRDAVMHLGRMKRAESSLVAAGGLHDSAAIVRATAARAVLSLPADEAAALLIPNLQDRDEFVRQETAYALGETQSRIGVAPLVALLEKEKKDGVRGAIAVALGETGDETAVSPLSQLLSRRIAASGILNKIRRSKKDENEFVRRAAARSLGQIRSRAAVPALIAVLLDKRAPDDVRREAANSLGLIGDVSAGPALNSVLDERDPYLAQTAREAILKLAKSGRSSLDSKQ
jgi:HEAT repeat protein